MVARLLAAGDAHERVRGTGAGAELGSAARAVPGVTPLLCVCVCTCVCIHVCGCL